MSGTSLWMPLYVGDYLRDTRRLTTLQHGIYMLLIMDYWSVGSLPNDDGQLAQIAGLTIKQWQCNRNAIASMFQSEWKHKRIDAELAKAADISVKRKANAEKRWSKCNASAYANDMHRAPVPQSQSQKRKEEETKVSSKKKITLAHELPPDWQPNESDFAYQREKGISESQFNNSLEAMRFWACSNGKTKKDWHATLKGFLRSDLEKPRHLNGNGHSGERPITAYSRPSMKGHLMELDCEVEEARQKYEESLKNG